MSTDKGISELNPVTTPLAGDELLALVQNGETKRATLGEVAKSGEVIKDTYANIAAAKAAGTLVEAALYVILDAGTNMDQTVVLTALSSTELSLHGSLIARNADYQDDGIYTDVSGAGTRLGVWHNTLTINYTLNVANGPFKLGETINNDSQTGAGILLSDTGTVMVLGKVTGTFQETNLLSGGTSPATGQIDTPNAVSSALNPSLNDIVIYNNQHWINKGNGNGTAPPVPGGPDWDLIPTSTANGGYITEVDFIEYDFDITAGTAISPNPAIPTNGWIQRRTDRRGNDIFYSKHIDDAFIILGAGYGFSAVDVFRWGSALSLGNSCNEASIDNRNELGIYAGNNLERASRMLGNISFSTSSITANRLEGTGCIIDNNIVLDNAEISKNVLDANTRIFGNIVFGVNAGIEGNVLYEGAELTANELAGGALIERNMIGPKSYIASNILGSNAGILENTITQTSEIFENNIGDDCFISHNSIAHIAGIDQNVLSGSNCRIIKNSLEGAYIRSNTSTGATCFIQRNILSMDSMIADNVMAGDLCLIESNNLAQGAQIQNNNIAMNNAVIRDITMGNHARLTDNTLNLGCRLENNQMGDDSFFTLNILEDGADFIECTIANFINFNNKTLLATFDIFQCHFGVNFVKQEDIDASIHFKRCEQGFSNFIGQLNLSVSAPANAINLGHLDHKFLEIAGIVILTNPGTTSFDRMLNFTDKYPIEFRASDGVTVTLVHTPVASATGDKFTIEGGANFDIVGRTNGSDFITFRNDNGTIMQISATKLI